MKYDKGSSLIAMVVGFVWSEMRTMHVEMSAWSHQWRMSYVIYHMTYVTGLIGAFDPDIHTCVSWSYIDEVLQYGQ